MAHHKDSKRLNKAISESGYCSRRQADKLIEQGLVTVNDRVASLGDRTLPNDVIKVKNTTIAKNEQLVYIALNKPVGITCTTDRRIEGNVVDFINHKERIFHIGRLDKPSEGLLLMTNDGDIVNKILRARNNHEKEYIVSVNKPVTADFLKRMGNGVPILDTVTRKCEVKQISKNTFRIVLTQGLNRQIRRMCEYLGYEVLRLKRTRIMNIPLDTNRGKWRHLTTKELSDLNLLLTDSSKTI